MTRVAVVAHAGKSLDGGLPALRRLLAARGVEDPIWFEVDKAKQDLYIVRGGVAAWAINTSTGTGAEFTEFSEKEQREITGTSVTPEGEFRVNRERPDGWWTGELGDLYRPKYFRGGVAVHGSNRIPNYPASHGCVRVSVAAMDYIWAQNIMPMKSAVWVHAG